MLLSLSMIEAISHNTRYQLTGNIGGYWGKYKVAVVVGPDCFWCVDTFLFSISQKESVVVSTGSKMD